MVFLYNFVITVKITYLFIYKIGCSDVSISKKSKHSYKKELLPVVNDSNEKSSNLLKKLLDKLKLIETRQIDSEANSESNDDGNDYADANLTVSEKEITSSNESTPKDLVSFKDKYLNKMTRDTALELFKQKYNN